MKSLIVMNYEQPVNGGNFRWGVLQSVRDTNKHPIRLGLSGTTECIVIPLSVPKTLPL